MKKIAFAFAAAILATSAFAATPSKPGAARVERTAAVLVTGAVPAPSKPGAARARAVEPTFAALATGTHASPSKPAAMFLARAR